MKKWFTGGRLNIQVANAAGMGLDEEFLADLYLRCLAWAMGCEDFKAPSRTLPMNEKIDRLIKESLQ